MSRAEPQLCVLITAHNRSNVLRLAIDSALRQTIQEIEVAVYCDGCSDDSAEVARNSGDARVRVIELQPKLGHQARVTNRALAETRARWIAPLNQDDLWLPDHLQRLLAAARDARAEIAVARTYAWTTVGPTLGPLGYDPMCHYPMSARLFSRGAFARVGPLADPRQLYSLPSDEWLYRAWHRGEAIAFQSLPTVVKIDSLLHDRSYVQRSEAEQRQVHDWLATGTARAELDAAVERVRSDRAQGASGPSRRRGLTGLLRSLRYRISHAARLAVMRLGSRVGIAPQAVDQWFNGRPRGGFQQSIDAGRGTDE